MPVILVSGLINIETTLRIGEFPLEYNPVNYPFFGIQSSVAGVGYNIARALTALGDRPILLSLIGRDDFAAGLVHETLQKDGIHPQNVLGLADQTAQSVIIYDSHGKRQIHVDLKNIQELTYPEEEYKTALEGCDIATLCNINFSRGMLASARNSGKLVATDVHAIDTLDDPYNRDFMEFADILFMSDENLHLPPEEWARAVMGRYKNRIVVIGLGAQGCLLAVREDGFLKRIPAVTTRPVVNSIGAGDALFSAFLHHFAYSRNPYLAIRSAVVFASYKIGTVSAADGFLNEEDLTQWCDNIYGRGWESSPQR